MSGALPYSVSCQFTIYNIKLAIYRQQFTSDNFNWQFTDSSLQCNSSSHEPLAMHQINLYHALWHFL